MQEEAKESSVRCCSPLRETRALHAHRTPRAGAELGSFSVCMFKLRVVFVRSGAGGGEGELGSVLLSVRRGSLHAQE